MAISDFFTRKIQTINAETSALKAAKLMRRHRLQTLIVIQNEVESSSDPGRPIGLLEEHILSREVLARDLDPSQVTVQQIMEPIDSTISVEAPIWEAIGLMQEKGLRKLPVIDNHQALIGLIAAEDMIGLLLTGLKDLVDLSKKQPAIKNAPKRSRRRNSRKNQPTTRSSSDTPQKGSPSAQPNESLPPSTD